MSEIESSAALSTPPNIVLIMTDQQRWDTLGCLGYDHMITPHIDRLTAQGCRLQPRLHARCGLRSFAQ